MPRVLLKGCGGIVSSPSWPPTGRVILVVAIGELGILQEVAALEIVETMASSSLRSCGGI